MANFVTPRREGGKGEQGKLRAVANFVTHMTRVAKTLLVFAVKGKEKGKGNGKGRGRGRETEGETKWEKSKHS